MTKKTDSKPNALTKRELINAVSVKLNEADVTLTKTQIAEVITQIFATIKSEIMTSADKKYTQPRFGTFEVRHRVARTGRSPKDKTVEIQIPASKIVGLKVSKPLKEHLNKK